MADVNKDMYPVPQHALHGPASNVLMLRLVDDSGEEIELDPDGPMALTFNKVEGNSAFMDSHS